MDNSAPNQTLTAIKQKIASSNLPQEVMAKAQDDLSRLEFNFKSSEYSPEINHYLDYLNFVCELPWEKVNPDILDLGRAKQILDKNHFGLESVKEKILEYLAVLILNKRKNKPTTTSTLAFVGLVGSGKTSLAYSIAESLGRPIIRVPFGGLGSAAQLRGESRIRPEAEPGLIIKSIKKAGVKNPVILLDELDRVAVEARTDVFGVLVELLDPEQNMAFFDHYLDLSFDLSQALFIATANNTNNISTAVLDRLELIEMPFYSDEQKVIIGKQYLLPQAVQAAGLDPGTVSVDSDIWPEIVRPLGFDGGIRSLKRTIDTITKKIARMVVEGQPGPFMINRQNINQYISK